MYYAVIVACILGCVGFLLWYRKKQAGSQPQAKAPQRGIIK